MAGRWAGEHWDDERLPLYTALRLWQRHTRAPWPRQPRPPRQPLRLRRLDERKVGHVSNSVVKCREVPKL